MKFGRRWVSLHLSLSTPMQHQHHRLQQTIKVEFQGRIRRFRVGVQDPLVPILAQVLGVDSQQLFVHDGDKILSRHAVLGDQELARRSRSDGRIPRFFAELKPSPQAKPPISVLALQRIYRAMNNILVEVKEIKRTVSNLRPDCSHPDSDCLREPMPSVRTSEINLSRDETLIVADALAASAQDTVACSGQNFADYQGKSEAGSVQARETNPPCPAPNDSDDALHSSISALTGVCDAPESDQATVNETDDAPGAIHLALNHIENAPSSINLAPHDVERAPEHKGVEIGSTGEALESSQLTPRSSIEKYCIDADSLSSGDDVDADSLSSGQDIDADSLSSAESIDADSLSSGEDIEALDDDLISRMADVICNDTSLEDVDISRDEIPDLSGSFVIVQRQPTRQDHFERVRHLSASIKKVEAEHEHTLGRLVAMGFRNSKLNASVLLTHNYDFEGTVEALECLRSVPVDA